MKTPSQPASANADACTDRMALPDTVEQRIQRDAIAAAQIYSNVNAACPHPLGTSEATLFKQHFIQAVPRIAVKAPDLTDLPGAQITGYYLNTSGPRGASGDGQMHAYGRYDHGYFICDQFGWGAWSDFSEVARAIKAATDAGAAA